MHRQFAYVLWLLPAATALGSCSDGDTPVMPQDELAASPVPAADAVEKTGSLALALTAGNGVQFDAFSWAITGPNFSRSGQIDVSNTTTVTTLIESIPVASDYSITLTGSSVLPAVATCSGAAAFDVTAGAVTSVPVAIACHVTAAGEPTPDPTPVPTSVPIPPIASIVLGFILLVTGAAAAGPRGDPSV